MIVYVEANFLLELALGQEQSEAASAILALAEAGQIQLSLPVFALSEPFSKLRYNVLERQQIVEALRRQVQELQRSTPLRPSLIDLQAAMTMLRTTVASSRNSGTR